MKLLSIEVVVFLLVSLSFVPQARAHERFEVENTTKLFRSEFTIKQDLINSNKKIMPEFANDMKIKGRALYQELKKMRKEQDFIDAGFGYSGNKSRYQKWRDDGYALEKECKAGLDKIKSLQDKAQSELLWVCVATNYLNQLGNHYAMNGSKDDKLTITHNKNVKLAFNIN